MNNFQYIVKDDTRAAMHMAVELCERGDFDSVTEAVRWLMRERDKTRWHKLFGTPELAARAIAEMCGKFDGDCTGCPLFDKGLRFCEYEDASWFEIAEWLRGDA